MATKTYEFDGYIKWPKLFDADEYRGAVRWLVNFYPLNEKQWELFRKSGLNLRPKEDQDGSYIQFRRDKQKKIGTEVVEFTPPFIYDEDGTPIVQYVDENDRPVVNFDISDPIDWRMKGDRIGVGNGTQAKVRVAVFDTQMGKGHRLENIKIVDLVEMVAGGSMITAESVEAVEEPEENTPATDFSDLDTDPTEDKKEEAAPKQNKKSASSKKTTQKDEGLPF